MGSAQSDQTRTATFENESQAGPSVLISEDVRKRFHQNLKERAENKRNIPPQHSYSAPSCTPSASFESSPVATGTNSYYRNASLYDLLAQNDLYWRRNMANMEQILHKTNSVMEQDFHTAFEQVQDTFARPPPSQQVPPCQNFKAKLFECYNENSGETLKCFKQVTAFADCVNKIRIRQIDSKAADYDLH